MKTKLFGRCFEITYDSSYTTVQIILSNDRLGAMGRFRTGTNGTRNRVTIFVCSFATTIALTIGKLRHPSRDIDHIYEVLLNQVFWHEMSHHLDNMEKQATMYLYTLPIVFSCCVTTFLAWKLPPTRHSFLSLVVGFLVAHLVYYFHPWEIKARRFSKRQAETVIKVVPLD